MIVKYMINLNFSVFLFLMKNFSAVLFSCDLCSYFVWQEDNSRFESGSYIKDDLMPLWNEGKTLVMQKSSCENWNLAAKFVQVIGR